MAKKDDRNQKSVYDEVKAFESRYGDDLADLPADLVAPVRTTVARIARLCIVQKL